VAATRPAAWVAWTSDRTGHPIHRAPGTTSKAPGEPGALLHFRPPVRVTTYLRRAMKPRSSDVPRWLAVLLSLLLVVGCAATASSRDAGRPHRPSQPTKHTRSAGPEGPGRPARPTHRPPPSRPVSAASAATVRAALDRLAVRPRPVGTLGYDRDAFGSDWVDTDHNGCNQRDDVLLRDAVLATTRVQQQGACDHDVLAGTWRDPYTGRTLRFTDLKDLSQAEAIQIDHVVPLAEAWVSGARGWSRDRRELFANDLRELLAVDGPTNMAKNDDDPAAWRPRKGYQCTYARRWVGVKARYRLTVDPSEKAALRQMLDSCP
jgi:hypothetical protein